MPRSLTRWLPAARVFRPTLTQLEDRSTPATFAEVGANLNLDLAAAESVGIVSGGTSYTLTLAAGNWTGTDSANVTGNGTDTLTVTTAGLAAFTAVNLTDSGSGATVDFNSSGANAYSDHFTVTLDDAPGQVTFSGSSSFGASNLSVTTHRNIAVSTGASVTSTSGNITLSANQQATATSGNFNGIYIAGSVTTGSGALTLAGRGGDTGGAQYGILQVNGSVVGSTGSGTVTVTGTGGAGTSNVNVGVLVSGAGTRITSGGGPVQVTGFGGGSGASTDNYGIAVDNGQITAGTGGAVTVMGTGGANTTGGNNYGVFVSGTSGAITSGGGAVGVTGTGGAGAGSVGVQVQSGGVISSGANAAITVTADSLELTSTTSVNAGTGSVTLHPRTAGTRIDLGGADVLSGSPRTLGLTDAELDRMTAGPLVIGGSSAGTLSLTAAITRPAATAVELASGADVAFAGGSVDTAGGALLLTPGSGGGEGVSLATPGADATAAGTAFSAGTRLKVTIAGPTPDAQFTRLVAGGAVNLSGVTLALSGGYVPLPGDSFAVVSAGSVVGTFAGLPNGAVVTFNGVNLRIFYSPTAVTLFTNRPQTITAVSVPASGVGGKPITVSATATDPDGDPLTFTWVVSRNEVAVASGSGAAFTFTPAVGGPFTVGLTVTDSAGATATATRTVVVSPPPRLVTAVGGLVRVINPLTGDTAEITPFPGFGGGVRVATGDLNGDGLLDVVVAAGPGGGPHVKVFDGANGAETASFYAYDPAFRGGVYVAATNGRIVVGAGAGGGPHVKVIDSARLGQVQADGRIADTALTASFYAFDPSFAGGVRVAAADTNNDLVLDVVVGAGPGGGPHVKNIDGRFLGQVQPNGQIADTALAASFYAFDPGFTGGVFVAAAVGKIAVGADAGGGTQVRMSAAMGVEENRIVAFDPAFAGGVRVGFADVNGDGGPDLLVAAGPGGGPHVKAFLSSFPFTELRSFYAGDPLDPSGVFVG